MSDITLITGNLTVSGNANLYSSTYLPTGYVNNTFLPFNPNNNVATFEPRYTLSNGKISQFPFESIGGPPSNWPYATGVLIRFGFYENNIHQLPTWINTMKWQQVSGTSLNPYNLRTGERYVINKTGEIFSLPWTSFNSIPNKFFIRARGTAFTLDERLNHIENSGTFALLDIQKIGFGTHQPTEKVDVDGNFLVENTGFFQQILINGEILDPDKQYDPTFITSINKNDIFNDNLY
jgi:hypothetical protein